MNCEDELKKLRIDYDLLKHQCQILKNEHTRMDMLNDLFNTYTITSETDLKGIITYVSLPFIEISGYSKEELIGQHHSIVRHEDMPKEAFQDMWDTIRAKKVWRGVVKNKKKNGDYYWVDSVVFPMLNHQEDIIGFKSIRIDITDKKKLSGMMDDLLTNEELILKL